MFVNSLLGNSGLFPYLQTLVSAISCLWNSSTSSTSTTKRATVQRGIFKNRFKQCPIGDELFTVYLIFSTKECARGEDLQLLLRHLDTHVVFSEQRRRKCLWCRQPRWTHHFWMTKPGAIRLRLTRDPTIKAVARYKSKTVKRTQAD